VTSRSFGITLVQIWYYIGTDLVLHWYRFGVTLVQIWYYIGTDLVLHWYRFGVTLVHCQQETQKQTPTSDQKPSIDVNIFNRYNFHKMSV